MSSQARPLRGTDWTWLSLDRDRTDQPADDALLTVSGTWHCTAQDAAILDWWVSRAPLRQRVATSSGWPVLALEPITADWAWVMGKIAASVLDLIAASTAQRLKVCANPDCGLMFIDRSRNRSKKFCSARHCGNITRVRRFRERTATTPDPADPAG